MNFWVLNVFCSKWSAYKKDLQSGKFCSFKVKHQPINHVKIEYSVFEIFIIISRSLSWQTNWREENFIYTAKQREHCDSRFWVVMTQGFPGESVVKSLPAKAGGTGSTPGRGRPSGGGTSVPIQYSFLGKPMDRGAWRAIVHGVTKTQKGMSTHVT